MKVKYLFYLITTSITLFACEGDPALNGFPDKCYATILVRAAPVGQGCPLGSQVGFNLYFEDENGNDYEFNNNIVENSTSFNDGIIIALPKGHSYSGWILNNGFQNNCSALDTDITIQISDQEVCTTISRLIDERPEPCCPSPDVTFSIGEECEGCVQINSQT